MFQVLLSKDNTLISSVKVLIGTGPNISIYLSVSNLNINGAAFRLELVNILICIKMLISSRSMRRDSLLTLNFQ